MPPLVDLKRQTFGFLTVIRKSNKVSSCAKWWCKCVCGKFVLVGSQSLKNGVTTSCGCKGKSVVIVCENCNKLFTIPKCREQREKCCSSECKEEVRLKRKNERKVSRKRICLICGKVFYPRQTQLDNREGKYCSLNCQWIALKGRRLSLSHKINISKSLLCSDAFKKSRKNGRESKFFKEVIVKGGYRYITNSKGEKVAEHRHIMMEKVSIGPGLVVHHIDGNKLNNNLINLKVLTKSEHAKLHAEERKRTS